MTGAAIFDLDRTLLQGGTGPLLSRAMYDLGVVTRKLPGESLLYGMFDLIGETLPSIFLARQATLLAKGRDGATFDAAAPGRRGDDRGRGPPLRARAHRAAPGGRPPGRARDDDPAPPDQAARRQAGLRRRHRDPLLAHRGRPLRRLDLGQLRLVARQARGGARSGRPARTSTSPRASPTPTRSTTCRCCRPSAARRPSTPTPGSPSTRSPGAGRSCTSTSRRVC